MKKKRVLLAISAISVVAIAVILSGCAFIESQLNSFKGSLIGVAYTADFYDNYGAKFFTTSGKKVDIDGNYVADGVDSNGDSTSSLSSVITITIDGKEIEACGNTVIFAEEGLKPDVEFSLTDVDSDSSGLSGLTSISKVINNFKNYFGKSRVVVIQSQLGVPICAYSGNKVYWEIPDDLPKMTKLMVDGKALYIHRANFEIIDTDLIQ